MLTYFSTRFFLFRKIERFDAHDPLRVLGGDEKGNFQFDNHNSKFFI